MSWKTYDLLTPYRHVSHRWRRHLKVQELLVDAWRKEGGVEW
jgi:hypothetical protein